MKKTITIVLVASIVLVFCAFTYQSAYSANAAEGAVLDSSIKIVLDGEAVTPVIDDGTPVLPITYNSTTYLPLRAMAYMLDMNVSWVGETSTVYMKSGVGRSPIPVKGEASKETSPAVGATLSPDVSFVLDGIAVIPVGDDALPVLPLTYNNTIYLPLRATAYLFGVSVSWDGATNTVTLTTVKAAGAQGPAGPSGAQGPAGPRGPAGSGITILGSYDSLLELIAAHPTGNVGDAYLVDSELYIWDEISVSWKNTGSLRGPQGESGQFLSCYFEALGDSQTVDEGDNVVFDADPDNYDSVGDGIVMNASGTIFTINQPGLYYVSWSINLANNTQSAVLGILENGAPASGAASSTGGNLSSGTLINVDTVPFTISLKTYQNAISLVRPEYLENAAASIRIFRFADGPLPLG